MFEDITEFEILPTYRVRSTSFDVMAPGSKIPLAQISRDEKILTLRNRYEVCVGPGLDVAAGAIESRLVFDTAGKCIGAIVPKRTRRAGRRRVLEFRQSGFGILVGKEVSADKKPISLRGMQYLAEFVLPKDTPRLHFSFRSDSSPGFDVVKPLGLTKRCYFSVHDPRISRLVLFTCFIAIEELTGDDPRKAIAEGVRWFDPISWIPRQKSSR